MQISDIPDGIKWIGGTITAILVAIGTLWTAVFASGKIRELKTNRGYTVQDELNEVHKSNNSEKTKAEVTLVQGLIVRVEHLEVDVKQLSSDLTAEMVKNAKLEAKNEHLTSDNLRQQEEITDLRLRNRELNDRIIILSGSVQKLEAKIAELTGQPLEVKLVEDNSKK